ncbi:hypothetical protein [Streptomyces sp. NPDC005438]|uniref:hypothetical protein n=1 Tax=Streptomyces sp. NPDC005438 TaxID=3156880 RepID=UPI0033A6F5FE
MRSTKTLSAQPESAHAEFTDLDGVEPITGPRVRCPQCRQLIALSSVEETLPTHGKCATPWDPFGWTVCEGSGASSSVTAEEPPVEWSEGDGFLVLTLPQGLDWRTQPFSHVGGPGSRPQRTAS